MPQGYLNRSNVDILNAIRTSASLEYQDRVPVATQANLARTARTIRDYPVVWNEFCDVLVNQIGIRIFNNYQFNNVLRPWKQGMNWGSIAMEIGANLLTADNFDQMDVNPWTADAADVKTDFYVRNRADVYGLYVNEELLAEAVENEGQLSSYTNQLFALPNQSAAWDEYLLMKNVLAEYQASSGFANYQVDSITAANAADKEAVGKDLVEKVRRLYLQLNGFYSRDFNARGVDSMMENPVVLIDAAVAAAIPVNVLASAFNMEQTEFFGRQVVIDQWPNGLEGTQALLMDGDFFRVFDILNKSASIYNPKTDGLYSYLHCRGIYAASKQRNAVRFSTASDNVNVTAASRAASNVTVALDPAVTNNAVLEPGCVVQLVPTVTYDNATSDANAYFIITAGSAEEAENGTLPIILPDTGTYVDRFGVLHVSNSSDYETMVITAVSTVTPTVSGNITLNATDYIGA